MTTDAYPGSAGERAGLLARVGRVFSFDTTVYEEVAAAPATLQALLVAAVAWTLSGSLVTIVLFFVMIPVGLAAVGVSALLTMTAARLFAGRPATVGEWYRALAFAEAPLVIGVIPFIGGFIAPFYAIAAAIAAISRVGADVDCLRRHDVRAGHLAPVPDRGRAAVPGRGRRYAARVVAAPATLGPRSSPSGGALRDRRH